jgi:hypothetical protein
MITPAAGDLRERRSVSTPRRTGADQGLPSIIGIIEGKHVGIRPLYSGDAVDTSSGTEVPSPVSALSTSVTKQEMAKPV